MVELTGGPPRILLTDHVEGDRPIMVYRVADHTAAVEAAGPTAAGQPARSLEIPQGPCSSFGPRAASGSRSTS